LLQQAGEPRSSRTKAGRARRSVMKAAYGVVASRQVGSSSKAASYVAIAAALLCCSIWRAIPGKVRATISL